MNKILLKYLAPVLMAAAAVTGCVKDNVVEKGGRLLGGESWVSIPFGSEESGSVSIATKATLGIVPESRVMNIYLYIFDSEGKRVYRHYFDSRNQVSAATEEDSRNAVMVDQFDAWYVVNCLDESNELGDYPDDVRTHGMMRIKAPNLTGGSIYAVANIDGDMVNISPEKLNLINTKAELLALTSHLNQKTTSRNGYFTMTASKEDITVQGGSKPLLAGGSDSWKLEFERLDAKIKVRVRTAVDYELVKEANLYDDPSGDPDTLQRLKSFTPTSWQVVNIPQGCSLFPSTGDYDTESANAEGYFDSEKYAFETTESMTFSLGGDTYTCDAGVFSFYMMENREKAKQAAPGYHQRDLRIKDPATGEYSALEGDMWVYAPQYSTYVIIEGEVQMEIEVSSEAQKQVLNASVKYIFHLGDFASDTDNYSVGRNTYYQYTITIKGVDKIELEVTTSTAPENVQEENTGAMGAVNVARESVYTFDAHYGQRVFKFDYEQIDLENTFWYVKTPFGKEGIPPRVAGKDIPAGYDYQWVTFKVNTVCSDSDVASEPYKESYDKYGVYPYKRNNQPYPGDQNKSLAVGAPGKLMNIVEFIEYLQDQKKLYDAGFANDFRDEYDPDWYDWCFRSPKSDDPWSGGGYDKTNPAHLALAEEKAHRHRIYVTVYVDEFYYHKNPITGNEETDYWKQFVNQPNRMMFILCDSHFSLDGDSSATGSVITIRQRAIQTPYNINKADLHTAWGTEVIDETEENTWFYSQKESYRSMTIPAGDFVNLPVNSNFNGLYNTVSNWEMLPGGSFKTDERWDAHMDFEALNDANYVFLKDDPADDTDATMRWSCMMRNRDLNGNGVIDPEEVRWYMAATEQINDLFLGGLGLTEEAKTYSEAWTKRTGKYTGSNIDNSPIGDHNGPGGTWCKDPADRWRNHIVSSTISSSGSTNLPDFLRPEEGATTRKAGYHTDLSLDSGKKRGRWTMRCVRNLGMEDATKSNIGDPEENLPEMLVKAIQVTPGTVTSSTVYQFDCSNVNEKSLRYYSTRELEPTDEFSESARLYKAFETGPTVDFVTSFVPEAEQNNRKNTQERWMNYVDLHEMLMKGLSPCPAGYRVPNIREATVMFLLTERGFWSTETMVCNYFSNGPTNNGSIKLWGNGNDYASTGSSSELTKCSWVVNRDRINIAINGSAYSYIRCVKDINL